MINNGRQTEENAAYDFSTVVINLSSEIEYMRVRGLSRWRIEGRGNSGLCAFQMDNVPKRWRLTGDGEVCLAVFDIWLRKNLWKLCPNIAMEMRISQV